MGLKTFRMHCMPTAHAKTKQAVACLMWPRNKSPHDNMYQRLMYLGKAGLGRAEETNTEERDVDIRMGTVKGSEPITDKDWS